MAVLEIAYRGNGDAVFVLHQQIIAVLRQGNLLSPSRPFAGSFVQLPVQAA